jgi:hypothetical protein
LHIAREISVRDVDRDFRITTGGGIAICSKGESLTVNDGKITGTNLFLILNVVHSEPIHCIHPRLLKSEGHSSRLANDVLDGVLKCVTMGASQRTIHHHEINVRWSWTTHTRFSWGTFRDFRWLFGSTTNTRESWGTFRDFRWLFGRRRHARGTKPRVMLVTVTIVLGGSGTCNETRWEIGDTIALIAALITTFIIAFLELTAVGIVRIDEALEKGHLRIRNRLLLRGLLLGRFRLGLLLLRNRLHMGKGRGNHGWTHLTLHRITVITLQSAWDFVAVQLRTKVRKKHQRLSLVHSGETLQHLTDKVGKGVCRGTTGACQEN